MKPLLSVMLCSLFLATLPAGAQEARWKELQSQAQGFLQQRNYNEGLRKAQSALREAERTFGREHLNVAASLYVFAELHRGQGTCREARPLHERALAVREKALGSEHPDVAQSLDSLALTYRCLAQFHNQFPGATAPLHKRALAIWEKQLGQDDVYLAARLNDLAYAYVIDGAHAAYCGDAEAAYQRSLAIQERLAKPEPKLLIDTLNGLARVYLYDRRQVERFQQGVALRHRAIEVRERMANPNLGALANDLDSLASVYVGLKSYSEAEPLFLRMLALSEQRTGRHGPAMTETYRRVGWFYEQWNKFEKAEPLYKQALKIMEAEYVDPADGDIADMWDVYAGLLGKMGRTKDAEEAHGRARDIRMEGEDREIEKTYIAMAKELSKLRMDDVRPEHAEAAAFLSPYVDFLRRRHRLGDAAKLEARLHKIIAQAELVDKYRYEEGRIKEMLDLAARQCGADHPVVARYLAEHAVLLRKMNRESEAKQAEGRARKIRGKNPQQTTMKPCDLEPAGQR